MTITDEDTRPDTPQPEFPGHLLPEKEWEQVRREAEAHPENPSPRTDKKLITHEDMLRGLGSSSFPSVDGVVTAKYHGGWQTPMFGVIHDAETPLAPGYARSIASYFTRNTNETSAHFMVDPVDTYQMLDTGLTAWHCGNGNQRSIGVEQAGYASYTRGQWTSSDGMRQIGRVAELMREIQKAHGIGLYMMDDATLLAAWRGQRVGGWATHDQCRRVLGGTSHTDPMPNYPLDILIAEATGGTPTPTPAPPAPVAHPDTFGWNLARGNYYGNINGPAQSHGGYYAAEKRYVRIIQQWFVYLGCTPVSASRWATTTWCDGVWGNPTDTACITWHNRFYPNQPKPAQVWSDDLARLFASRP